MPRSASLAGRQAQAVPPIAAARPDAAASATPSAREACHDEDGEEREESSAARNAAAASRPSRLKRWRTASSSAGVERDAEFSIRRYSAWRDSPSSSAACETRPRAGRSRPRGPRVLGVSRAVSGAPSALEAEIRRAEEAPPDEEGPPQPVLSRTLPGHAYPASARCAAGRAPAPGAVPRRTRERGGEREDVRRAGP